MLQKKLIIGTAGLQKDYGINKSVGLSKKKVSELVDFLNLKNFHSIDTAVSYKGVEKKLGGSNLKKFFIYSKIPKLPKKCCNINEWLSNVVNDSLKNLDIKSYEAVLVHNTKDLLNKKRGVEVYKFLYNLKMKGFTKKIGLSVYNFSDLFKIIAKFKFDIVQLPFNIFDRRLLFKDYIKRIKNKKMEIHVRSIFLQGLLLKEYKKIPKYFKNRKLFYEWENWCHKNNISKIQCCVNFISNQKYIDKIVVGPNSIEEILDIKKHFKKITNNFPKKIFSNDINLIDPRRWKQK